MPSRMNATEFKSSFRTDTVFSNSYWDEADQEYQTIGAVGRYLLRYEMEKVKTYQKLLTSPLPNTKIDTTPLSFTKVSIPQTSMESI